MNSRTPQEGCAPLSVEAMLEETLQLFDEVKDSEQKAHVNARIAAFKEDRTRRKLGFRVGSALVGNLKSPARWIQLPVEIYRAYRDYKRDKERGFFASLPPIETGHSFLRNRLNLVLRSAWQAIEFPHMREAVTVSLKPLSASNDDPLVVLIRTECENVRKQLLRHSQVKALTSNDVLLTVTLSAGVSLDLFVHSGPPFKLWVRKDHDRNAILCFMLERAGSIDVPPPNGSVTPVFQTVLADERAVILQAHLMMCDGKTDDAIEFARLHAKGINRPAINLLKANAALADEAEWLSHVNAYVSTFGISEIELRSNTGTLHSRLSARASIPVDNGTLVSVIMPAYQAEQTIRIAVESILNQTWRPLELIVVDDHSDDNTWKILKEISATDTRIKLIRNQSNLGPYVSKNIALSIVTGELVTGQDADDWAHPQRLERHLDEILPCRESAKVSMTRMLRMEASGYFGHFAREGKGSDDGALRDATMTCMFDTGFLRRRLGFWDSVRFGADSEMIARCRHICGSAFVNIRQLSVFCLDAADSLTNDPVHGVSKIHGVAPSRAVYRDHWTQWHKTLKSDGNGYVTFPHDPRKFEAPEVMVVSSELIESELSPTPRSTTRSE